MKNFPMTIRVEVSRDRALRGERFTIEITPGGDGRLVFAGVVLDEALKASDPSELFRYMVEKMARELGKMIAEEAFKQLVPHFASEWTTGEQDFTADDSYYGGLT